MLSMLLFQENHTEASHDGANEIPTSSTVGAGTSSLTQVTEDIAGGYRSVANSRALFSLFHFT